MSDESLNQQRQEYRDIQGWLKGEKPPAQGRTWRRHLPAPLVKVIAAAETHPVVALGIGVGGLLGGLGFLVMPVLGLSMITFSSTIVESIVGQPGTPQAPGVAGLAVLLKDLGTLAPAAGILVMIMVGFKILFWRF